MTPQVHVAMQNTCDVMYRKCATLANTNVTERLASSEYTNRNIGIAVTRHSLWVFRIVEIIVAVINPFNDPFCCNVNIRNWFG